MNVEKVYPFVVFSVFREKEEEALNKLAHEEVKKQLTSVKIPFKEVVGSYEGSKEDSLLLHKHYFLPAFHIASEYDQDSILDVDEDRKATIRFLDGRDDVLIGRFVRAGRLQALNEEAYIYDKESNQYWIVQ